MSCWQASSAGTSLAGRRGPVPLREVAGLPLIGARLERCRMEVDAHFRAQGLQPRYVFRSDENGTVRGLVAAGVGVGIVPRLAVDPRDQTAIGKPRRRPSFSWRASSSRSSTPDRADPLGRRLTPLFVRDTVAERDVVCIGSRRGPQ
jgi:DNA-binding transcriptional LysR family regulator